MKFENPPFFTKVLR